MRAVILYGPPAAGKDTVTKALTNLDGDYRLYRRLKVGEGRTEGYRPTSSSYAYALRRERKAIWENRRYGALYIIDRPSLVDMLRTCTPVVHLGQIEAIKAITGVFPDARWTVAWLWCPRDVALRRIIERSTGDTAARLRAWDDTTLLPEADISINTAEVFPTDAAKIIHRRVQNTSQTIHG